MGRCKRSHPWCINSLRPRRNRRHFVDDIFKWVFLIKMYEFRLGFHWSLFLRFELTIFQHWFRLWLGSSQATSHYLNQWWLVYWRIYASLSLNELTHWGLNKIVTTSQISGLVQNCSNSIALALKLLHSYTEPSNGHFRISFLELKIFVFRFSFHLSLFLMVQFTISPHWIR